METVRLHSMRVFTLLATCALALLPNRWQQWLSERYFGDWLYIRSLQGYTVVAEGFCIGDMSAHPTGPFTNRGAWKTAVIVTIGRQPGDESDLFLAIKDVFGGLLLYRLPLSEGEYGLRAGHEDARVYLVSRNSASSATVEIKIMCEDGELSRRITVDDLIHRNIRLL